MPLAPNTSTPQSVGNDLTNYVTSKAQAKLQIWWNNFTEEMDQIWAPDQDVAAMQAFYTQMAAIPCQYIPLSGGAAQPMNCWVAMFEEALDFISIIQVKQPQLLENLPLFTDGTIKYLSPGWALDANLMPLAPKVLA